MPECQTSLRVFFTFFLEILLKKVVHFRPKSVVHFDPKSIVHFSPKCVVHYSPKYSY
jgi:hypothetical protein